MLPEALATFLCIMAACDPPAHPVASSFDIVLVRNEGHARSVDFTQVDPQTGSYGLMNGKGAPCLTQLYWNGHKLSPPIDMGQTMHLEIPETGRHLLVAGPHSGNCPNFGASRYVDVRNPNQQVNVTIQHQ